LLQSSLQIAGYEDYALYARYWQAQTPSAVVVMVHGIVSHSQWMDRIAKPLMQNNISCLAVDRRGAGMNNLARGDSPSEFALIQDLEAIVNWTKTLNIPLHLCGFCWGSCYVVNYLIQSSARISSVIHIAPSLFQSKWILQRPFEIGDASEATEEPVMPIDQFTDGPLYQTYIKPDPLRLRAVSLRMNRCMQSFSQGIWMKFLRLKQPCLMLIGKKDTVVDNEATLQLFNRLKVDPKAIYFLDAHHGIQFEQADATVSAIVDWINRLQQVQPLPVQR